MAYPKDKERNKPPHCGDLLEVDRSRDEVPLAGGSSFEGTDRGLSTRENNHGDSLLEKAGPEIRFFPPLDLNPEQLAQIPAMVEGAKILVLGSGNGSNFEALHQALEPYGVTIAGLFCDVPGATILERARRLGVSATVAPPEAQKSRRALNDALLRFLEQPFALVALAGYMRILPPRVVQPYAGRIVNIHPSLLPAFPGLHAIEGAHQAGVPETGVTLHLVNEEIDAGPILAQGRLSLRPQETVESLEERIHRLEHRLYPGVILRLLAQRASTSATAEKR